MHQINNNKKNRDREGIIHKSPRFWWKNLWIDVILSIPYYRVEVSLPDAHKIIVFNLVFDLLAKRALIGNGVLNIAIL